MIPIESCDSGSGSVQKYFGPILFSLSRVRKPFRLCSDYNRITIHLSSSLSVTNFVPVLSCCFFIYEMYGLNLGSQFSLETGFKLSYIAKKIGEFFLLSVVFLFSGKQNIVLPSQFPSLDNFETCSG